MKRKVSITSPVFLLFTKEFYSFLLVRETFHSGFLDICNGNLLYFSPFLDFLVFQLGLLLPRIIFDALFYGTFVTFQYL